MNSPLVNFDIGANYWGVDPQLKAIEPFASMYKEDKTKKKSNSSLKMWAIALFADPESRLCKLSKKDKESIIYKDYLSGRYEDFKWEDVKEHINAYRAFYLTQAERSLVNWEEKLQERDAFLKEVKYTLEDGKDLDAMLANTEKLYKLYGQILERIAEEAKEGVTKGGRTESISEKKLI
jgi:hypothetical protein